ncbi:MAG: hypothetical protein ACT4OJ_06515 [Bacteroidota bacterium]
MALFRSLFFLSLFIFFSHFSSYSQKKDTLVFTGSLSQDILSLFKHGFSTYDVMNGIKPNTRLAKLGKKLNEAIKKNYSWYVDHLAKTPDGEPAPYHENLGLTKTEYEEFLALARNITAASTGRVSLIITLLKQAGSMSITFPKEKLLGSRESFSIGIRDSLVYYCDIRLLYTGISEVDNDNNGLQSKWKGHIFVYEMPAGLTPADLKDPGTLTYHSCKLTIALLEKTNKVLIHFRETKIENGVKTIETDWPLVYSNDQRIAVNW